MGAMRERPRPKSEKQRQKVKREPKWKNELIPRDKSDELARYLLDEATDHREERRESLTNFERLPLHDVTSDVDRFGRQYELASQVGLPLPCILTKTHEIIPVDADALLFLFGAARDPHLIEADLHALQTAESAVAFGQIQMADPEDVRDNFRGRLRSFLVGRLSGTPSSSASGEPPLAPPGYLEFTVHAPRQGLRVHYHPAYWRETTTAFGQPTSPVRQYILPGRYIFGAVGPDLPLTFDDAEYDVPPHTSASIQI